MSIKILTEVMDHAPEALSSAEHRALMILAEDANEKTRMLWRDIDDPVLLRRLRMNEASFKNMRTALRRKGCLEMVGEAHRGSRPEWRIPILAPALAPVEPEPAEPEGPESEAPEKGHQGGDPSEGERVTESDPLSARKGHQTDPERVTEAVTLDLYNSSRASKKPLPPPRARVQQRGTKDGGGGETAESEASPEARSLADGLWFNNPVSRAVKADLVAAIDTALHPEGIPLRVLVEHLAVKESRRHAVVDAARLYLHLLKPENLPAVTASSGRDLPEVPWCGECEELHRQRDYGEESGACCVCNESFLRQAAAEPSNVHRAFQQDPLDFAVVENGESVPGYRMTVEQREGVYLAFAHGELGRAWGHSPEATGMIIARSRLAVWRKLRKAATAA